MFTLPDYQALLTRILDPSQPNYSYPTYHHHSCIHVIDAAPTGMRSRLAAPLLDEALAVPINPKQPEIFEDMKWRYELGRRVKGRQPLITQLLLTLVGAGPRISDHLSWLTALSQQSGVPLVVSDVRTVCHTYPDGDTKSLRAFICDNVQGADQASLLGWVQSSERMYREWRREEDRLNTPG